MKKLIAKKKLTEKQMKELIVTGSVTLVSLSGNNYDDAVGTFCHISWDHYKEHPDEVPFFNLVMEESPHCKLNPFKFSLRQAVEATKIYEETKKDEYSHTIIPTGFIFHESHCGSTLVANSLETMNPTQNLVYSEADAPLAALSVCEDEFEKCSIETAAKLFQNVVYMMGRTNDAEKKYLFFKIQSIGTRYMKVLEHAFPDTPWIFIYREPIEVLVSHMHESKMEHIKKVQSRYYQSKAFARVIESEGITENDLTLEDFCAIFMTTLCQIALDQYYKTGVGELVNYLDLKTGLSKYIIPRHFKVPVSDDEKNRIKGAGRRYSVGNNGKNRIWMSQDTADKRKYATDQMYEASERWMRPVFIDMEREARQY